LGGAARIVGEIQTMTSRTMPGGLMGRLASKGISMLLDEYLLDVEIYMPFEQTCSCDGINIVNTSRQRKWLVLFMFWFALSQYYDLKIEQTLMG
jgi:hypothetical protein